MSESTESNYESPKCPSIAGFDLEERVGGGAYGDVYRAIEEATHDVVALKVLKESFLFDEEPRKRLKREFDLLARLPADHLCRVRSYGEAQTDFDALQPYIVMDFYPGGTAADLIGASPTGLPYDRVISIAEQLGLAMKALPRDVVHRDIKPSNLLLDTQGQLKLSDFGLAKVVSELVQDGITKTGARVGTPGWIPCEVILYPERPATAAWDVFSAGVTLWELASGSHPFRVSGQMKTCAPCDPSFEHTGSLSHPVLRRFLLNCLESEQSRRIQDGSMFLERLREVQRVRAIFDLTDRTTDRNWTICPSQCQHFELRYDGANGDVDVLARDGTHEGMEFALTDVDFGWPRGSQLRGRITSGSCTLQADCLPEEYLVLMFPEKGDIE